MRMEIKLRTSFAQRTLINRSGNLVSKNPNVT